MSTVTAIGKNKIIQVKSSDRLYGIPSNFAISLSQYNLNPAYCSWHQVAIPNGFYNVNATSCTISITVYDASSTAWPVSVSIPQGNYSSTSITSVLVPALNTAIYNLTHSAGMTFFAGSLNSTNGFYTLSTSVSAWTFTVSILGTLDYILGFRSSQTGSAGITATISATGAAILDLRSYPNIYIRCSLVSGNVVSGHGSDSVLCCVQNTALFGQTIFQRSPMPDLDIFPVCDQLAQISFQLVDEWGNELTMNTNQDWEMSICLYFS